MKPTPTATHDAATLASLVACEEHVVGDSPCGYSHRMDFLIPGGVLFLLAIVVGLLRGRWRVLWWIPGLFVVSALNTVLLSSTEAWMPIGFILFILGVLASYDAVTGESSLRSPSNTFFLWRRKRSNERAGLTPSSNHRIQECASCGKECSFLAKTCPYCAKPL